AQPATASGVPPSLVPYIDNLTHKCQLQPTSFFCLFATIPKSPSIIQAQTRFRPTFKLRLGRLLRRKSLKTNENPARPPHPRKIHTYPQPHHRWQPAEKQHKNKMAGQKPRQHGRLTAVGSDQVLFLL
ncbi:hypothetical protein OSJ77_08960, partial [Phyllobacterium sp. 0TCS1.6C]|uniref:hypothetical protein n=1 Tax=Phyllobacterium sp. 0TCS1.6C TaxID=2995638 RepID=UPI0022640E1C